MKINQEGPLKLLRESVKLRLKKTVEKLFHALRFADTKKQASLNLLIVKMELLRFIKEERPHIVFEKIILDVSQELESFLSGSKSARDYIKVKKSLTTFLELCRVGRVSFVRTFIQAKESKEGKTILPKTFESQRMSQASLVSFRKAKKW